MTFRFRFLLWGQKQIEKGAWYFAPFSFCWAFMSVLKNWMYDTKLRKISFVDCPVISVGNLVAGGTGKTPFVHLLASRFSHRKVAILSRSYGQEMDEPILLQKRAPFARVYVGKDRVMLARKAIEEGADLLLLDDGFQYRKLHRDFDFVLLNAKDPFGKGHYLPWGFLRDSPKRLSKADAIFVLGDKDTPFSFPHVQLKVKVERILDLSRKNIESIRGKKVAIFCGVAKPLLFEKTVKELGADVVFSMFLADHQKIPDLDRFSLQAIKLGAEAIVCTEKDIVKIDLSLSCALPLLYLEISLEIAKGGDLWENLIAKINQKIDNPIRYGQ